MSDTPLQMLEAPDPPDALDDGWFSAVYLAPRADFVRRHRRVITLIVVAVSLLTCALMAAVAGWPAVSHRLHRVWGWFIPVMLGAHAIAYGGYLVAHHGIIDRSHNARHLGWRLGTELVMIGFGAWLLNGGFAVDRNALETAGVSRRDAYVAAIALGVLELALLAPAAWICALLLIGAHGIGASFTWPWVVLVPPGILLAIAAMIAAPRLEGGDPRALGRAFSLLGVGTRTALEYVRHPRCALPVIGGIAVYWAGDIVAMWAALRCFGVSIAFDRLILAYATGYIFTRRTLPFAGVIVLELLLIVSLSGVGVPLAAATLAVLIYRVSDFGFTLVAALIASSLLERRVSFLPEAARVAELANAESPPA